MPTKLVNPGSSSLVDDLRRSSPLYFFGLIFGIDSILSHTPCAATRHRVYSRLFLRVGPPYSLYLNPQDH